MGAHLVTLASAEENVFVYSLFDEYDIWLCATDEAEECVCVWETGEPWKYETWLSGVPNNCCPSWIYEGKDCTPEAHLAVDSTGSWNDTPNNDMSFVRDTATAR